MIWFTEAMYLLGAVGGYHYQSALWSLRSEGRVVLHTLTSTETSTETDRMAELMSQYRDTPMDLADSSLIVVAESLSLRSIFTVDADFHIYRLFDGSALNVLR
jgi:predicted nucleic acid-binding protein